MNSRNYINQFRYLSKHKTGVYPCHKCFLHPMAKDEIMEFSKELKSTGGQRTFLLEIFHILLHDIEDPLIMYDESTITGLIMLLKNTRRRISQKIKEKCEDLLKQRYL